MMMSRVKANASRRVIGNRPATTAVEFAFVGPILFLMMFGIFEYGSAFMTKQILTDAARRACREAIIEGTSTATITSTATTYLTEFGMSGESVSVIINDGNGNITEAQNVPAYSEMSVTVQVDAGSTTWLPTGIEIWIPGFGYVPVGIPGTLSGQFTMRRE
jgi:Flp pilus assembly protein TadG